MTDQEQDDNTKRCPGNTQLSSPKIVMACSPECEKTIRELPVYGVVEPDEQCEGDDGDED